MHCEYRLLRKVSSSVVVHCCSFFVVTWLMRFVGGCLANCNCGTIGALIIKIPVCSLFSSEGKKFLTPKKGKAMSEEAPTELPPSQNEDTPSCTLLLCFFDDNTSSFKAATNRNIYRWGEPTTSGPTRSNQHKEWEGSSGRHEKNHLCHDSWPGHVRFVGHSHFGVFNLFLCVTTRLLVHPTWSKRRWCTCTCKPTPECAPPLLSLPLPLYWQTPNLLIQKFVGWPCGLWLLSCKDLSCGRFTKFSAPELAEYMIEPIEQGLTDKSSYVRQAAIIGVGKLHRIVPSAINSASFH